MIAIPVMTGCGLSSAKSQETTKKTEEAVQKARDGQEELIQEVYR